MLCVELEKNNVAFITLAYVRPCHIIDDLLYSKFCLWRKDGNNTSRHNDVEDIFGLGELLGINLSGCKNSLNRERRSGIISIWDPTAFSRSDIWCDDNYVIVKGTWVREKLEVFMVNVYAPQMLADKVVLWSKLSSFMNANPGNFILMGDWNAVRVPGDRCGSDFCAHDAREFNDFIDSNILYEVPLGGLHFTWRTKAGDKLSKLDRFFVSDNVLNVVNDLKGLVLPCGYSDHSPILLFQDKVDFGPTYFKIFDSWFARADFEATVKDAWSSINRKSNDDIVVKMRAMKQHLKNWIHMSRDKEDSRLIDITNNINNLDVLIDAGNASQDTINRRNSLAVERDELIKLKESDVLQKARIKWDVEGDENSKFFHCSMKHKRRNQNLQGLMVDG
ncbi:uncharacterized protein [Rutidosis leptorrhynchoides]|uniref:uncharacterized protein n=1 Tax=Rutidosis leptorrhynchoides TaxID=125765 RepID=UPI003A994FE2